MGTNVHVTSILLPNIRYYTKLKLSNHLKSQLLFDKYQKRRKDRKNWNTKTDKFKTYYKSSIALSFNYPKVEIKKKYEK